MSISVARGGIARTRIAAALSRSRSPVRSRAFEMQQPEDDEIFANGFE